MTGIVGIHGIVHMNILAYLSSCFEYRYNAYKFDQIRASFGNPLGDTTYTVWSLYWSTGFCDGCGDGYSQYHSMKKENW